MKYFISVYTLFFVNFFIGCQGQNDLPPAAIEFHEFPIHHPNILDDEDWLFEPVPDSSGQSSPLGAGGAPSQSINCLETITVDFEPTPFGNLVQTIPYHIQKEPMQDAFISVKVATHQLPWIIWFHSENVLFASNYKCKVCTYEFLNFKF